jgi:hypothetical protein
MSDNAKSLDQNWLVNTGSWSLTMESGIPWSLTTVLKNTLATDVVVYGCPSMMEVGGFQKPVDDGQKDRLPVDAGGSFDEVHRNIHPNR